ncbi:MAG: hypothetical protein KAJ57_06700 [Woeseiaceae bacterium]|nr:hypothetical protein [Woeseiaceae bacterium]
MKFKSTVTALVIATATLALSPSSAHENHECPAGFPDSPVIAGHLEHHQLASGMVSLRAAVAHGEDLFVARFNRCDGQGRPATTGAGDKRFGEHPAFIRTSAPESNSCAGCHAQPRAGGAGDIVANVFVLAQALDPVTTSVSAEFSNERNTLGMFGSGAIEMLAREMSIDLQSQAAGLLDGEHTLSTKGIDFDITVSAGAVVAAQGIDTDLVVKPFHQAGVVTSIREFTVNAMNHHHGMQAEERFDLNVEKGFDPDFDEDGIDRELTIGDITAATLFQAQLSVPRQVWPQDPRARRDAHRGQGLCATAGCTGCHKPALYLDSRFFVEPNPFNPAGTCADPSVCSPVSYDMTRFGEMPRLDRSRGGGAVVRAYTDLKRHNLCDDENGPDAVRHYCNEQLSQGRPEQDGRPGAEFFLTRKLWDVGNSAPYGHRGDLTTITEAILAHGGEARSSRDAFTTLPTADQAAIVRFLKSLQVVSKTEKHR